jgi:hypothetical protein
MLHRRSEPETHRGQVSTLDEPAFSISFFGRAQERGIPDSLREDRARVGCVCLESDEISDGRETAFLPFSQGLVHESDRVATAKGLEYAVLRHRRLHQGAPPAARPCRQHGACQETQRVFIAAIVRCEYPGIRIDDDNEIHGRKTHEIPLGSDDDSTTRTGRTHVASEDPSKIVADARHSASECLEAHSSACDALRK